MIKIETLRQVTHVYCHGHCPDGLASAMILKDAFRMLGMSPRIEFLTHGTPEHQVATDTIEQVLFCDIAPKAGAGSWLVREKWPIVLDHHVGAKAVVESFGSLGVYADAEKEPGVSGAVLAFREVWLSTFAEMVGLNKMAADSPQHDRVRDFALCVGARDTWQTQDGRFLRGQWTSKMLMSKPAAWWLDESGHGTTMHHAPYLSANEIEMGRALFEAHEEAVRQAVEQVVRYELLEAEQVPSGGRRAVYLYVFQEQASGFRLCSDVSEALRKQTAGRMNRGVVAGFSYVVDKPGASPRLLYSLRGLNDFDVQKFATANGGGGHKAAAGFSVDPQRNDVKNPYEAIRYRLEEFLRGIDK